MRFTSGWVKIWRIDSDHWMNKNHLARHLWWELITMATWKPTKIRQGRGFAIIPPGTIITSKAELAERLSATQQQIRYTLDCMADRQQITQQATNRGRIITLCNWDKYQTSCEEENQQITRQTANSLHPALPGRRPTDYTLSEEEKKLRIKEELNPPLPPAGGDHPLVLIWNQNTDGIPRVAKMTKVRKAHADARLRESPDLEQWTACAKAINNWQFGRGVNDRGWKANFDYFLRPATLVKFLEGGYDEKPVKSEKREIRRNRDGSVDTRTAITYGRTESDKAPWEN